MARHPFGGTVWDWVMARHQSSPLAPVVAALQVTRVYFYDAATGGSAVLDLQDTAGNAVVAVDTDENGFLGTFYGPDNVTTLWADAGTGDRRLMVARDSMGPEGQKGNKGDTGNTGAPGGSDAAQAGWVNDPASATRAALSATYAARATTPGVLTPEAYGAVGATRGTTGNMTSGSAVLTDSGANFQPADVGKTILVGITGYSSALVTTIASRQSATQVTLAATAPSAQTNVGYLYGPDCTTALTNLATAAVTGSVVWLSGLYLISGTGPSFGRVKIMGNGSQTSVVSQGGVMGGSGIVSTSATAVALTENGQGTVMEDFGVWNLSATTPTAGAGIYVQAGTQGRKRNVLVSGFYDCLDYSGTSGRYWHMNGCKVMDPVRYGIRMRNTLPSGDEGDMTIDGGTHFNTWSSRTPDAAVRWESGGGLKFLGNKINQGMTGPKWQVGIDLVPADGVSTSVFPITGNSIENCTTAAIRMTTQGSNTGKIFSVAITGNEIGALADNARAIWINPAAVWLNSWMTINSNVIKTQGGGDNAIDITNLTEWQIGPNVIYASFPIVVRNGCNRYSVDAKNITKHVQALLTVTSANSSTQEQSQPVISDTRSVVGLASGAASGTLWQLQMPNDGAVDLEVTVAGIFPGTGKGGKVRTKRYLITRTNLATAVVSTPYVDQTAGFGTTLDVTLAITAGVINLGITHTEAGLTFTGNVSWRVAGMYYNA